MFAYRTVVHHCSQAPAPFVFGPAGYYACTVAPRYRDFDGPFTNFAEARYYADDSTPPFASAEEYKAMIGRALADDYAFERLRFWCFVRNMSDYYRRIKAKQNFWAGLNEPVVHKSAQERDAYRRRNEF
jgi:hypothetical protein